MDRRFTNLLLLAGFAWSFGCATTHTNVADSAKPPTKEPSPQLLVSMANNMLGQAAAPNLLTSQRHELREQARLTYEQALNNSRDYLPALKGLVELYVVNGDHENAAAISQRAYQAAPKDADLRLEIGSYWARQQDWQPAIQCFRDALALEPGNHKFATTLGFTLACAGEYADSLDALRAGGMSEADAHYNIARMLHRLNKDDQCRTELKLALEIDSAHQGALKLKAELDGSVAVR